MDGEEPKQGNNDRKFPLPSTQLSQIDSDLTLAMRLQDQERAFLMFTMGESENDEFSDEDDDGAAEPDPEFVVGDEEFLEADVLYPEEEGGSNYEEEDMEEDESEEEDEVDPDEMSYEELLELGEVVGIVNKGLSAGELANSLRPYQNKFELKREDGVDRCVVCQVEYEDGESLVMLPCDHPFHSDCISKWLQIKKVCPICSSEVSSSSSSERTTKI